MDESLLELLNPNADFKSAGSKIVVASIGKDIAEKVSLIVVDRSDGELLAYADDRLIAAYPATIGSANNPSPSGTHKIKAVVTDPSYTYNPDKNFQQGDNKEPLEIRRVLTAQWDRSGLTFQSPPTEFMEPRSRTSWTRPRAMAAFG